MNRNEIIKTANDVGINKFLNTDSHIIGNFLESFAKRIAEVEREACASLEVEVIVPTKDYSSMTPLDCYEAALMDQAIAFRAAIRARGQL
jgi:hypothetical protein